MSLLTDTDLRTGTCIEKDWSDKNKIHIFPYEEECLTPVGYDVRVGNRYASAIDAKLYSLAKGDKVVVKPQDTVLITTLETIEMPINRKVSAFITSKVSKVSKGLSHISTNIDPDWRGNLLIAIHNPSTRTVSLDHGEAFCTLNFILNNSPSTKDCGKEPGRSDVLLSGFVEDVKQSRDREEKQAKAQSIKNGILKAILIVVPAAVGYYLFQSTSGFIAMTALGVGLAGNISWGKRRT
jgi:deoxycytidine triphosphate deaminase